MAEDGGSGSRNTPPRRSTITALLPVAGAIVAVGVVAALLAHNPTLGGAPTSAATETTSQTRSTPATLAATSPTATDSSNRPVIYPVPAPPRQTYPLPQRTVTLTPGEVPTGAPLSVAYYLGPDPTPDASTTGFLYSPAEESSNAAIPVDLAPGQRVQAFTPFGSGYLLLVRDDLDQTDEMRYYASPGHLVQLAAPQPQPIGRLALGSDGSVAVAVTTDQLTLYARSGTKIRTWMLPHGPVLEPLRVLPDHSVLVMRGTQRGRFRPLLLEPNGAVVGHGRKGLWAAAVNPVTGDLALNRNCGSSANGMALLGSQTRTISWVDCNYQPGPFDAQGTAIAAVPNKWAYRDNYMLAFVDPSTGDIPLGFRASSPAWSGSHVGTATWEDDTHVLITLRGKTIRLLRLGLDGTAVRVPLSVPKNDVLLLPQ